MWTSVLKESLWSSFNLQALSNYRLQWKPCWCPFRATKKTNQRGQGQVSVYLTLNSVEWPYTLHQYAQWHLFGVCRLICPSWAGLWKHRLLVKLMCEGREFKPDRLTAASVCYVCCSHWKIQLLVPRRSDQLQLGLNVVNLNHTMTLVEPALYSAAAVLHLWHPGTCTRRWGTGWRRLMVVVEDRVANWA